MDIKAEHMLFGPYGADALAYAGVLAESGANAVWFHGFDARAFDVCGRHRISACVEFPTFRADFARRPELIPIGSDGKPIRYGHLVQGVCLSNPSFLDEIEFSLSEGLRQFEPKGIWLDYLTYAGWFETADPDLQESCFCKACIADFCETHHLDADCPAVILQKHAALWRRHKCEKIAKYAARYAGLIHARQPDCIIGAYLCPWTPDEYDGALTRIFAQDFNLLAGAIDIYTPLIYAAKSGRAPDWGKSYLEESGNWIPDGKKVQLILDYLDFPESLDAAAASKIPSWGIQVYAGSKIFTDRSQAERFRLATDKIRQAGAAGNM